MTDVDAAVQGLEDGRTEDARKTQQAESEKKRKAGQNLNRPDKKGGLTLPAALNFEGCIDALADRVSPSFKETWTLAMPFLLTNQSWADEVANSLSEEIDPLVAAWDKSSVKVTDGRCHRTRRCA